MNPILDDIRILKLAQMYERAYERFVLEMAQRYVRDVDVQRALEQLAKPRDRHAERISRELTRLTSLVGDADRASLERAALLDVLEVERAAREFYVRFVEHAHDPKVATLFRELASEERRHETLAEGALALSDRKAARVQLGSEAEKVLRTLGG